MTDHTQDDDNDEDSEDSISHDESSDDEYTTPPTASSAQDRRCNESLALGNPFVMGHKRSLWSSIQTDTKRPARKRILNQRDIKLMKRKKLLAHQAHMMHHHVYHQHHCLKLLVRHLKKKMSKHQ